MFQKKNMYYIIIQHVSSKSRLVFPTSFGLLRAGINSRNSMACAVQEVRVDGFVSCDTTCLSIIEPSINQAGLNTRAVSLLMLIHS